ncbi:MAG: methyltransferase FkbM, partial [Methanosarcinales archaeon]|nr:methyltransferase FkbM [Methanosarcinales archaeon]
EMAVFEGMGKYLNSDFVDYIQFEYGGTNLDSMTSLMNFYELFETKGFKLAKVMPNGLQLRNHETFLENFEYSNYVAISEGLIEK